MNHRSSVESWPAMIDYKNSKVIEPMTAVQVFESVAFVIVLVAMIGWLITW